MRVGYTATTFSFAPFASRAGQMVVGIRGPYSEGFTDAIKEALRVERQYLKARVSATRSLYNPGGWLPDQGCWFVEVPSYERVAERTRRYWIGRYDTELVFRPGERPVGVAHHEATGTIQFRKFDTLATATDEPSSIRYPQYEEYVKAAAEPEEEEVTEQALQPAVTRMRARYVDPNSEDVLVDIMIQDL